MLGWLLSCAMKASLLLAASWVGASLLRRGPAAARHQIWMLGVLGALLVPVLCWVVPSLAPSAASGASPGPVQADIVAPAMFVSPASDPAPTWPTWLAIVWTVGALAVAVRVVRGHLAAWRLVRMAEPYASTALEDVSASLGLRPNVRLLRSAAITSPMTVGVLRPCVVVPAIVDAWSSERLRSVLLHELGHVRRHDTLVQLAAQLACALYWWNPLAWLAASRLRIEREHACDDLVLGTGVLPSSYAADLLDIACTLPHGAVGMADVSSTEVRLLRILDANATRRPLRRRFQLATISVAVASCAAIACTSSPPVMETTRTRGTLTLGAPISRETYPFGAPVSHGAIDLSLVANELQTRLGDLEQCYQRRLAATPGLAGTVVIHWTIVESGTVPEACITSDTVGDPEIADCVNQLVREGRPFPAPRGGPVSVSFPFVFSPTARVAAR